MSADIILAVVGSSALFSFVTFLIQRADAKKNDRYVSKSDIQPLKDALLALSQDRLEHLIAKYLSEGQVSTNQAKVVDNLVTGYTALGGNDFMGHLYEQFKELPIK